MYLLCVYTALRIFGNEKWKMKDKRYFENEIFAEKDALQSKADRESSGVAGVS